MGGPYITLALTITKRTPVASPLTHHRTQAREAGILSPGAAAESRPRRFERVTAAATPSASATGALRETRFPLESLVAPLSAAAVAHPTVVVSEAHEAAAAAPLSARTPTPTGERGAAFTPTGERSAAGGGYAAPAVVTDEERRLFERGDFETEVGR
jgi:hypothetical protein